MAALAAAAGLLSPAMLGDPGLVGRYRLAPLAAKAMVANPLCPPASRYRAFLAYWQRTTAWHRVRFAATRRAEWRAGGGRGPRAETATGRTGTARPGPW